MRNPKERLSVLDSIKIILQIYLAAITRSYGQLARVFSEQRAVTHRSQANSLICQVLEITIHIERIPKGNRPPRKRSQMHLVLKLRDLPRMIHYHQAPVSIRFQTHAK